MIPNFHAIIVEYYHCQRQYQHICWQVFFPEESTFPRYIENITNANMQHITTITTISLLLYACLNRSTFFWFLLCSVAGLYFFFAFFVNLLLAVTFFLGANSTVLCKSATDLSLLENVSNLLVNCAFHKGFCLNGYSKIWWDTSWHRNRCKQINDHPASRASFISFLHTRKK